MVDRRTEEFNSGLDEAEAALDAQIAERNPFADLSNFLKRSWQKVVKPKIRSLLNCKDSTPPSPS